MEQSDRHQQVAVAASTPPRSQRSSLRILFISMEYPPDTGWGGIGTYVRTMARALARRGHDVHVLSVAPHQSFRDLLDDGVRLHRRPLSQPGAARLSQLLHVHKSFVRIWGAVAVGSAVRTLGTGFDVIEVPDWMAEGLLLRATPDTVLVGHLHTPLRVVARWTGLRRTPDLALAGWLEGVALRHADMLVAPTRAMARDVARAFGLDARRINIVPLPVEVPSEEPREALAPNPSVLFVGRLEPRKNPAAIIRAAPLVLRRHPHTAFIFCGMAAPRYLAYLQRLADDLGILSHMRFEGHKLPEEVQHLRRSARVCVVPSWYENFPYALAEAMAAGRAVVASNAGGIPEILQHGVSGWLVAPDDVAGWGEAISRLLGDDSLAVRLGDTARATVIERFHPSSIAAARESLLLQAVAER